MKYIKRSGVIAMLILTGLFLPNSMTVEAIGTQDNPVAGNATFQTTQQQKFVSGNVTDAETQEPLIGVSIKIKGTNIATVTDANGHYQLQLRTSQDCITNFCRHALSYIRWSVYINCLTAPEKGAG